ncbi:hypothetical protein Efla_003568 [Eimeria flavescens]
MCELFKDLQFVQVYMDDIVVRSTTLSSHHGHWRDVFQRLQENAFHLNLSKCSFDADCIDFLGFQISPASVQQLAANVSSIHSMPSTFSSRTVVRYFLGRANYYSHFAPHFSTIAAPLHRLTSNTTPLCWSPPCRSAVANIKYLLASSPILSMFDGSLPTRITCDASSFGIGAVLEQQHPDGRHPTQFIGRTLSKPERNYPVIDKEWLAVIYALTKSRHYLQQRFCIRIDHKPIVSLLLKSSTQLQDRRARWIDLCMQFSFKIEHMSGKDNVVADLLSKFPEKAETSFTIASARSRQGPAETPFPAAYARALTAAETHARDALMSDLRRSLNHKFSGSSRGNPCILVFMDKLTKMLRLSACPQQLAAGKPATLLNEQLPQDLFSENAAASLDKLHSAIAAARSCISTANEGVRARGSANSQQPFVFHTGDSVLLSSRCFRASRKLDSSYVGPFKLVKQTTPKTFELEGLPEGYAKVWNIHHFKPYYMSSEDHQAYRQQTPPPSAIEFPDIYEVDNTSDCWHKRDGIYYLVRWKRYPNPSWEPLKILSGCQHSLEEFGKQVPYDKPVHSVPTRDCHRLSNLPCQPHTCPSFPANPQFSEPPATFHAVQYPEDRWVHPDEDRHQLSPAFPDDREREEPEAEERRRESFRREDAPDARSPRSAPRQPVSSPEERGPPRATEVLSLQGSPSTGVSANECRNSPAVSRLPL